MNTLHRTAVGIAALVVVACGGRLDDPNKFQPAAIDVEAELLPMRCGTSGCHTAANPAQGLDLVSAGVAARVVNIDSLCEQRPLVSTNGSYVIDKIVLDEPACGGRMPPGTVLDNDEITALQNWAASIATSTTSTTST